MAEAIYKAESACDKSDLEYSFADAHEAYELARARMMMHYADPIPEDDAEAKSYDERSLAFSAVHGAAINRVMLAPAESPLDVLRKMRIFRAEELHDGWTRAGVIVAQLVEDAENHLRVI